MCRVSIFSAIRSPTHKEHSERTKLRTTNAFLTRTPPHSGHLNNKICIGSCPVDGGAHILEVRIREVACIMLTLRVIGFCIFLEIKDLINITDKLSLVDIGNNFISGSSHRESLFGKFLQTECEQCEQSLKNHSCRVYTISILKISILITVPDGVWLWVWWGVAGCGLRASPLSKRFLHPWHVSLRKFASVFFNCSFLVWIFKSTNFQ